MLSPPSLELELPMRIIVRCVDRLRYYFVFSKPIILIAHCVGRFRYYIVFSKPIMFTLGLIFSYKLVEKSFFGILITHLTDEWKDLLKAVIVVNLQEGTEAVLQILLAFIADAYTGLFKMVCCSTTLYIIGLLLSWFAARKGEGSLNLSVFYPALMLMTLSQAAKNVTLRAFLGDQLARDQPATKEDEERAESRANFWWNSAYFLAATVAVSWLSNIGSIRDLSMVSSIAMGAAFLWFLLGIRYYAFVKPTGSPLCDVGCVIYKAIDKRNVEYPEQIPPHVSWLRWLDRAAVVVQQEEDICTADKVKGVKCLINMVPMWTTFLTFSLVVASGSTFFLEEANSINDGAPILLFPILQRFTQILVSKTSDYVLEKLSKKNDKIAQRMMLMRIGVGMIFCPLCCVAAWANAFRRWQLIRMHGIDHMKEHMSVFSLIPQFLLLAIMQGLSEKGLEDFFDSQVSRSMSRYGPPFGECALGVGKFFSVVCILILSGWFWETVNDSRLDKYYVVLAILGTINIVVYCLVAHYFLPRNEIDIEMANSEEADLEILGECVEQSHSSKIVPVTEESGIGDDLTNSELSEKQSLPLLKPETGQERSEFSDTRRNDDDDDDEAEKLEPDDIGSVDSVSTADSESTPSTDGPMASKTRSFSRVSSRGIHNRSSSMRRS